MNPIPPATNGEVSDLVGPDSNPDSNPGPAISQSSLKASTALENGDDEIFKRLPSLRSISDPATIMNPSSHPLRALSNARRPAASSLAGGALSGSDAMHKARFLAQSRNGMSPAAKSPAGGVSPVGFPNVRLPPGGAARPGLPVTSASSSSIPRQPQGLSARRGMKLNMNSMCPSPPQAQAAAAVDSNGGGGGGGGPSNPTQTNGATNPSKLDEFRKYIDTEKGWITFEGAATITDKGVNFTNGRSFSMSLDEVELMEELGKGNYGTVYRVRHAKPSRPRFGTGLSQTRRPSPSPSPSMSVASASDRSDAGSNGSASTVAGAGAGGSTGVIMAMKEIRLELDEAKFTTILKELVILHECVSPYIIDFYGAFFQEGAVYMCIEYMDGGSIDKLYAGGVPEEVLRRITYATIMGLKSLKEEHSIIHRDVKPTNVLVNTRGQVKICDFGVSGNLVASIAKTNIGCQSYMAPERISLGDKTAGGVSSDGTYSVQSDIWSLGLTIIECAMGMYPYPPEASANMFDQLQAIVSGEPPDLPAEGYSPQSRDFVRSCLNKIPSERPTYDMLLKTPWIKSLSDACETIPEEPEEEEKHEHGEDGGDGEDDVGVEAAADGVRKLAVAEPGVHDPVVAEWVLGALERRARGGNGEGPRPALDTMPLDSPALVPPGEDEDAGLERAPGSLRSTGEGRDGD